MIMLYQFATSPFSEKIRRAMAYKGIAYEIHEVARAEVGAGRYAKISPTGKFPAIDHDGRAIWDSTDILRYLDGAFPDRPLIPLDPREAAQAHVLEDWADESLYFYEMTMRLSWAHNLDATLDEFSAGMPGVPREHLRTMILDGVGALTKAQGVGRKPTEQVVADVIRHFNALDALLDGRDWLVGEAPSIADLAVVAQVNALIYAVEAREALAATRSIKPWMARVDLAAPASTRVV